ncbi:hypothetical protein CC86DRAFT_263096, partial [Ophiobolus disseminans]
LAITLNRAATLRHLRLSDCARVLWVDAMCIHQNDSLERGQQMQTMGHIYARAQHVHCWFGPD